VSHDRVDLRVDGIEPVERRLRGLPGADLAATDEARQLSSGKTPYVVHAISNAAPHREHSAWRLQVFDWIGSRRI
jgi:hypothetical protein